METDWETSENDVATEKAAMLHMGGWAQANFTKFNASANLGFIPFPIGNGKADATFLSSVGWVFLVNKDSKNLELAKKYTTFILTSKEAQKWMTEDIGGVPCCNTDLSPSGDLPKDTQTYINAGETTGWIHTIVPTDYGDTCGALLQSYLSDGMSKDDVKMGFQDYFDSSDSE